MQHDERLVVYVKPLQAVQDAFFIHPSKRSRLRGLVQFIRNIAAHWRDLVYKEAEEAMLGEAPEWVGPGGEHNRMVRDATSS